VADPYTEEMRKLALIFALGALAAFPQYASAQAGSGIDQYEENIPGAGGDRPTGGDRPAGDGGSGGGGSGSGAGGSGSGSVGSGSGDSGTSPASDRRSERADAGAGPADAGAGPAAADAPTDSRTDASGSRQDTHEGVTSAAAGSDPVQPLNTAEDSAGEGGMGLALPIILGASLVAALAFLVARRLRNRRHAAA
jgi:hypothetical protein